MMLLIAWAAVAAYRLADRPTWPRAFGLAILIGLGGATKLSPLLLSLPFAGLGAVLILERWISGRSMLRLHGDTLAMKLLSVPVVAYACFVAAYPFLWPHPIEHTRQLFQFRADSFRIQAAAFPQAAVPDLTDALRRVGQELGSRFSVSERVIAAFDWPALTRLGERWQIGDLDLALATAGMLLFVALVVRAGLRGGSAMVAIALGGQVVITVGAMRVEYARYLLPVLLASMVCIGVVVGQSWALITGLYIRWREMSATSRSSVPVALAPVVNVGTDTPPASS